LATALYCTNCLAAFEACATLRDHPRMGCWYCGSSYRSRARPVQDWAQWGTCASSWSRTDRCGSSPASNAPARSGARAAVDAVDWVFWGVDDPRGWEPHAHELAPALGVDHARLWAGAPCWPRSSRPPKPPEVLVPTRSTLCWRSCPNKPKTRVSARGPASASIARERPGRARGRDSGRGQVGPWRRRRPAGLGRRRRGRVARAVARPGPRTGR
jgi:hypothetical protein